MGNIISKAKAKRRSSSSTSAIRSPSTRMTQPNEHSEPIRFNYHKQAQKTFSPPLIAHDNHFLGDVYSSIDSEKPISAGFYHLKPGAPLEYMYTYHEMKIILEGEVRIRDASGQEVLATSGDVFYFPKGSVITFSTETPTGVKAFYCGQRAEGAA